MPNENVENVETVQTTECNVCSHTYNVGSGYEYDDNYCSETCHFDDNSFSCQHCGEPSLIDDGCNGEFCSRSCYNDHHNDYDSEDGIQERKWSPGDFVQFQDKKPGDIIKSTRAFSVEIESYFKDYEDAHQLYNVTPKELGISKDGSLGDYGIEIQTPKLRGQAGEKLVKDVTRIINNLDFYVDRSCGLHIHIDGKDLLPKNRTKSDPKIIRNLLKMYIVYEDVIQSFLPKSRRNNSYARALRNSFHLNEIDDCYNLEKLEKMWYRVAKRIDLKKHKEQHYNSTRYNGLNLHSLFAEGHYEIRYHSGTTDYKKIMHWVQLHLSIIDKIASNSLLSVQPVTELTGLQEKTTNFFELIDLPIDTRNYYIGRQSLFNSTGYEDLETKNN